ncbi:MAG: acyl-CoA dehydrogenase family protein [Bacillota bacterium]|nr:acyl-CoA dehydrogenase family protein [Bacillota bacterium]
MSNLYFTEDHEGIRDMVAEFAEKELANIRHEVDETEQMPEDTVATMKEMGLMSLLIPEEYGGAGMDLRAYTLVTEELCKELPAASIYISALACEPILYGGSEEQKQEYLPKLASGEITIAFGLTEPNAGSDAASIATKAVKNGDEYILNGTKTFISMAPLADYTIVFAKTAPELGAKGISAFIVDMKLPGVSTGKPEEKMGQKGAPVSDVILQDVHVPASCMIGEENMGFINAMKTLNNGRTGVAAMALGMSEKALELAVQYSKDRVQFGKPLCKHQAISFMLADMKTKVEAMRELIYHAAYSVDMKEKDATVRASMAKYFACENAIKVISDALQIFGGYGYSREYQIEQIYRDIRVCAIYEGSSQVQEMVISGSLLK